MRGLIIILCLLLGGCSTTAKRYTVVEKGVEKDVLELKGIGKGKWADGSEIEGKPILEFPKLPDIEYER